MGPSAAIDPRMPPWRWRRLTPGERRLCGQVFAAGLDADRVRIFSQPAWPRPFVLSGSLVVWPSDSALADFSTAPLWLRSVLVHELVHVWQAQNGVFLPFAKLKAGDGQAAYAYDLADGRPFSQMNIEQQAMVVQHAYMARGGAAAPYDSEAYARILEAWPEPLGRRPREI
ncbi:MULTISPECIES: hypothetical protein [unclassified Phenylobacterium]|uniref:hypothetical protein n=1 Tax=unclassified Phenylobacterium TaxID=2640670 RepID=UPI000ADC770D|nr:MULTISPECIES: hypothetical protein [unclassified Phenylobacterium]